MIKFSFELSYYLVERIALCSSAKTIDPRIIDIQLNYRLMAGGRNDSDVIKIPNSLDEILESCYEINWGYN